LQETPANAGVFVWMEVACRGIAGLQKFAEQHLQAVFAGRHL
jgi:hypothetical protein